MMIRSRFDASFRMIPRWYPQSDKRTPSNGSEHPCADGTTRTVMHPESEDQTSCPCGIYKYLYNGCMMAELRKVIKARKLTQAKAAKILGVSQSRVSDLVRGKWEKFSLEMLITLATRAGIRVEIKTAA